LALDLVVAEEKGKELPGSLPNFLFQGIDEEGRHHSFSNAGGTNEPKKPRISAVSPCSEFRLFQDPLAGTINSFPSSSPEITQKVVRVRHFHVPEALAKISTYSILVSRYFGGSPTIRNRRWGALGHSFYLVVNEVERRISKTPKLVNFEVVCIQRDPLLAIDAGSVLVHNLKLSGSVAYIMEQ
jgi:hypothetical protein